MMYVLHSEIFLHHLFPDNTTIIRSYCLKSAAFTGGRDTWLVFSKPNIMGPALSH